MFNVRIKGASTLENGETRMRSEEFSAETVVCVTMTEDGDTLEVNYTALGDWDEARAIAYYTTLMKEFGKDKVLTAVMLAAGYYDTQSGEDDEDE